MQTYVCDLHSSHKLANQAGKARRYVKAAYLGGRASRIASRCQLMTPHQLSAELRPSMHTIDDMHASRLNDLGRARGVRRADSDANTNRHSAHNRSCNVADQPVLPRRRVNVVMVMPLGPLVRLSRS
jgi:hypothetical protein